MCVLCCVVFCFHFFLLLTLSPLTAVTMCILRCATSNGWGEAGVLWQISSQNRKWFGGGEDTIEVHIYAVRNCTHAGAIRLQNYFSKLYCAFGRRLWKSSIYHRFRGLYYTVYEFFVCTRLDG